MKNYMNTFLDISIIMTDSPDLTPVDEMYFDQSPDWMTQSGRRLSIVYMIRSSLGFDCLCWCVVM